VDHFEDDETIFPGDVVFVADAADALPVVQTGEEGGLDAVADVLLDLAQVGADPCEELDSVQHELYVTRTQVVIQLVHERVDVVLVGLVELVVVDESHE